MTGKGGEPAVSPAIDIDRKLSNPMYEMFAQAVAAGCSLGEAARRAGYSPKTAYNAGSRTAGLPVVARRIEDLKRLRNPSGILPAGLRSPGERVTAIEQRYADLKTYQSERAALFSSDPDLTDVPGGKTGLVALVITTSGTANVPKTKKEFKLDVDLLNAFSALEEQARQDLGQAVSKRESFSQSISVKMDSQPLEELNATLRAQAKSLPPTELAKLILDEPELQEYIDVVPEPDENKQE